MPGMAGAPGAQSDAATLAPGRGGSPDDPVAVE